MNVPTIGRFVVPSIVASHFHFKLGDKVADFGAGAGTFLAPIAQQVGKDGVIVACEIQKAMVEKIASTAKSLALSNVNVLWCDIEKPRGIPLPDEYLDGAILVNTLFQLEDKFSAITEIQRVIRTGGLFHIIDWSESFGGLGPTPAMVVEKKDAIALAESQGFFLEKEYPAGDHHYGLMFRSV
jgi:ubiquinone/menaquinone biosynthesis C-methylase UbiE